MLVLIGLISFVAYVAIGVAEVPPESPLADPNYVIRPLNDATVSNSHTLPPSADYPINQLNNGEEWLSTLYQETELTIDELSAAWESTISIADYLMEIWCCDIM